MNFRWAKLLLHSRLFSFSFFFFTATAMTESHAANDTTLASPTPQEAAAQSEISCYALPYGGLGFASHVLTYLTVYAFSHGRAPLMPWRRLRESRQNLWLTALSGCLALPMTVVSMARCHNTWPFILVAVWKLVFSTTQTVMGIHAALIAGASWFQPTKSPSAGCASQLETGLLRAHEFKQEFGKIWWWCIFYFLGAFVGFVGIMAIAGNHMADNEQLRITTGAFGAAVFLVVVLTTGRRWRTYFSKLPAVTPMEDGLEVLRWSAGFAVFVVTLLFALYSDWALAAVARDNLGMPTSANAPVYWCYLVAKRLPMLSS